MDDSKEKGILDLVGTAFASILLPGLGHLSCGKFAKAISLYVASQFLFIVAMFTFIKMSFPYDIITSMTILVSVYAYSVTDSVLLAKDPGNRLELNPIYGYCLLIGVLIIHNSIVAHLIRSSVKEQYIEAFKIPTDPMFPALLVGDRLLADKRAYLNRHPKRDDIVVYRSPDDANRTLIRRIVGVGGETIEVRGAKIYVNNSLYTEQYPVNQGNVEINERNTTRPFQVPANSYFVMGDNRDQAHDNRYWGLVDREKINGKAVKLYWSWDKSVEKIRWGRIGREIK